MSAGSLWGNLFFVFTVAFTVVAVAVLDRGLAGEHRLATAPEGKGAGEGAGHATHADPPYLAIFAALSVLTAIELAVPSVLARGSVTCLSALGVLALVKALLVAMFFMHLKFEGRMVYGVVLIAALLIVGTLLPILWDVLVLYGGA